MTKIIYCLLVVVSISSFAKESNFLTGSMDDDKTFKPHREHWITSFGFEGMKYELPFKFEGQKKNYDTPERDLYGIHLGFGKEFKLPGAMLTTAKVEGYYLGTLFEKALSAKPNADIEVANSKRAGQFYGFEYSQGLSWLFDMKTKNPFLDEMTYLTVEPFIEGAIGFGSAYNRQNWKWNSGPIDEFYRATVEDKFLTQRVGGGVNLISTDGYFFYLKASLNNVQITDRKTKSSTNVGDNDPPSTDKKIDPIVFYSIGGGLKF